MSSIPIIKFMFSGEWSVLGDALGLAPAYESESYSAAGDLTTALGMAQAGLVVASLRDKNDLIQLATLMKMLKRLPATIFVKIIVVNFSDDKQYEKAVAKLGILDMVESRIQTKALRFKIDFMMKSVNVHLKKAEAAQANNAVKTVEAAKVQDKKSADFSTPQWKNALENENDIWLLKNEADCKKILTRWLVKLMGPSPYVAQWVDSNSPGVWRFDFKSEAGIFINGEGAWFYKGDQKPDFIWAENTWSFTGSAFDLFYKEGTEVVSRLSLKDKQLVIAKNSDYAKTKEQNIIESFDKDLVFKKEMNSNIDSETVDKDAEIYKNLEGKGKTDSVKQNPLAGKGKTSHLNSNPLSLDLEPGDNDLSNDPLSQKGSNSKQSGYLKGKNSPESQGEAKANQIAGDKFNSGENLDLEAKNTHQTHYKNHNEAEKFDAKEIGHAIKKDGVSDNLKGKTATDALEGHLKSPEAKESSPQAKKASEMGGKSFTELMDGHLRSPDGKGHSKETKAAAASEMSGKSSTDKLPGHLKSADGKEAQTSAPSELAAKERSKPGKEANASSESAELDAKAATDKLAGHLKGIDAKEQSKESKEAKASASSELDGKSVTDKLAGYLKSANGKEPLKESKDAKESALEQTSALSGKSATDKLAGHLKSTDGKERSKDSKENGAFDMSGKSSTDKLDGHLGGSKDKKEAGKLKTEQAMDDLQEGRAQEESARRNANGQSSGQDKVIQIDAKQAAAQALAKADLISAEAEKRVGLTDPSKDLDESMETAVVTAVLSQDLVKVSCRLDDYYDNTIIFTSKRAEWNVEKTVTLNLNFNYMGKDSSLKFNGNVAQIDMDDEGLQYISVEISKENQISFNSFMKLYAIRQEKIVYFMKAAKGY